MMTRQEPADYKRAFLEACARVLGKIPDESLFRPHTNPNGEQTITWNSYNKGMIGLMTERRYREQFGDEPEWLAGCHLHHRHLLRALASRWDVPLPLESPTPIVASPDSARDYTTPSPPSDPRQPSPLDDGTVDLEAALPRLAKSTQLRKLIREQFGKDRAKAMFAMMREGNFVGEDGDELHDYLLDGISNDSVTVWETVSVSNYYGDEEWEWGIWIRRFHGVFRVESPECDPAGLFLSLRAAKDYVYANWENAK